MLSTIDTLATLAFNKLIVESHEPEHEVRSVHGVLIVDC